VKSPHKRVERIDKSLARIIQWGAGRDAKRKRASD
jgi:hypothetical protein